MPSMSERLRRIEAQRKAQSQSIEASRQASFERLFEMRAYVEEFGVDTELPEHLMHHPSPSDRATIEWLRSSGSGWVEDPDAIALLEDWEAEINEHERC